MGEVTADAATGTLSDSDYEKMRTTAIEKKTVSHIKNEELEGFLNYMKIYLDKQLDEENYMEAKDASTIIEACKAHHNKISSASTTSTTRQVTPCINTEKRRKAEEKITKFDDETKEKLQNIKSNHQKELEEFEAKWREEMPEQYRRMPARILDMRETARSLAMAGHFDEAQLRKEEADKEEEKEVKVAQFRLNRDYKQAKHRIISQQNEEITNFENSRALKRELLVVEVNSLTFSEQKRAAVLRTKPMQRAVMTRSVIMAPSTRARKSETRAGRRTEKKLPPLKPPNTRNVTPCVSRQ